MDQPPDSSYVPRAPRFQIADSKEAVVSITRTEEIEHQTLAAELVDVSQYGVKLRVPVNLRFEEALQLKIGVLDTELEYLGVASVRHIRALDEEHWVVGCAIAPPLSDEAFAHLATTAGTERRRFRRLPIAAEATVRRQAQTEATEATLHNLSSGGICFSSDEQYAVGESIQISVDGTDGEPRVIEARICWQVDSPDGSIAGCQFSSSNSYAEICACLTEQPTLVTPNRHNSEPTSKLVLTAAVLAMFVPPMMTLMFQANKVSAQAGEVQPVSDTAASLVDEAAKPCELLEQTPFREWVDNTGKHRTRAELVEVTSEYIMLKKSNGRPSKVPWCRLSEADQTFARAWQVRQE